MIQFTIPGEAVGKGRPKGTSQGGFVRMYTPKKTVLYESLVTNAFLENHTIQDIIKKPNGVRADIHVYKHIPKSYSKKKVQEILNGNIHLITKPDVDNVAKSILDALNGFAYEDDSQVYDLHIRKEYVQGESRTTVLIYQ